MFKPGCTPHNKKAIDEDRLAREYAEDRGAIRRLAEEYGMCVQALYKRLGRMGIPRRKGGDATTGTQAKDQNPNWKGGRFRDSAGYWRTWHYGKLVREHRILAEAMLGRPLTAHEVIHHKDGDTSNNSLDNIEVLPSQSEHMKIHMTSAEARRRAALAAVETKDES